MPFNDPRGCKEWLNALPLTNIPQAQALVLEALRGLNAADLAGLDRLKCLELMRDKIAFLQGEQRSRYFGKTLPLSVERQQRVDHGPHAAGGDGGGLSPLPGCGGLRGRRDRAPRGARLATHHAIHRHADAVPRDGLSPLRPAALDAPAPAIPRRGGPERIAGARQGLARGRGRRVERLRDPTRRWC